VPVHNNSNSISPLLSKAGRMMKVFSSKFWVFFKNARVTSRCALNLIGLALFIYILSFPPPPQPGASSLLPPPSCQEGGGRREEGGGAVGWGRKGTFPEGRAIVFQIDAFSIFAFPLPLGVDSSNEDKPVKLYVVKEYL